MKFRFSRSVRLGLERGLREALEAAAGPGGAVERVCMDLLTERERRRVAERLAESQGTEGKEVKREIKEEPPEEEEEEEEEEEDASFFGRSSSGWRPRRSDYEEDAWLRKMSDEHSQ